MGDFKQYTLPNTQPVSDGSIVRQPGQSFLKGEFKSPNYAPGEQGWKVDEQGNADFQSVTVSGYALDALRFYGSGSDGNLVVSTTTTLTADKFYNNLTIDSGVIFNCGGYRLYTAGNLINNGTIRNNGNSGGNGATGAAGGAGGSAAAANGVGNLAGSTGSDAGGNGNAAAGSSTGNSGASTDLGSAAVAGGNGGAGFGGAGGTAGTIAAHSAETLSINSGFFPTTLTVNTTDTGQGVSFFKGSTSSFALSTSQIGSSGAGGGGDGSLKGGGGGGGGATGAIVYILAKTIINNGTISAIGGNGGNGGVGNVGLGCGGGGGGAGGTGGVIVLGFQTLTNNGTITVAGGTGGTGGLGQGGGNNGANGNNGNTGTVYKVALQ